MSTRNYMHYDHHVNTSLHILSVHLAQLMALLGVGGGRVVDVERLDALGTGVAAGSLTGTLGQGEGGEGEDGGEAKHVCVV